MRDCDLRRDGWLIMANRITSHGEPWSAIAPRRKRRAVSPDLAEMARGSQATGQWLYEARHGGGVANKYGYAALTECYVAVVSPRGNVSIWYGELNANKVTLSGVARVTGHDDAAPLWDARTRPGSPREEEARAYLRAQHHRDHPSDDGSPIRCTYESHSEVERIAVEAFVHHVHKAFGYQ